MSTHEQTDDTFGFEAVSNSSIADRIKGIKPSTPSTAISDMSKIDKVADSSGFVSREIGPTAEYTYGAAKQRPEPRIALNMRAPESVGVAFQRFCQENRYSYPEALEEIMKRAGVPTK